MHEAFVFNRLLTCHAFVTSGLGVASMPCSYRIALAAFYTIKFAVVTKGRVSNSSCFSYYTIASEFWIKIHSENLMFSGTPVCYRFKALKNYISELIIFFSDVVSPTLFGIKLHSSIFHSGDASPVMRGIMI